MSEIQRVLKPSGFAFVTVWSDPLVAPGSDRNVGFPTGKGNNVQRLYHFFTRRELEGAAKAAGLEVADAFFEAGGKRTGTKNSSKARNLCMVLQKPRRGQKHSGKQKGRLR